MIHDQRTRDFTDQRRQKGDSRKDTLRVLKRYIARETFNISRAAPRRAALRDEQAHAEAA